MRKKIQLKELCNDNFILPEKGSGSYEVFSKACEKAGFKPNIIFDFPQANTIMSYVSARNESASNANVESMYQLLGGKVEALEFIVKCECSFTNVPLRELRTKKNNLIACIGRKRQIIIPNGEDHLEVGDSVVDVTMDHVDKFNDILE